MELNQFKALSFDCYGTLIDWESGMISALKPLVKRLPNELSRSEILQAHAVQESTQQVQTPSLRYRDLLAIVYKRLAESWGISVSHRECVSYGQSVTVWPAFPDSIDALQYLKRHFKLIVLSNVDNASFSASKRKLKVRFDAVFTAEDIGSYKPADRNFEYMLEKCKGMGLQKHDLLHTAESMFHDHAPANKFGIASCHIYRRHAQPGFGATMKPAVNPQVDFCFNSMAEMAEAHRRLYRQ